MIKLTAKSISDLRIAIAKSYGSDFERGFSDEDLQEIGNAFLTIMAEHLKIKTCSTS